MALNQKEQAHGLQLRSSLDEDKGMLFVFSENRRHNFWMKDTLIPLDIIWLDYARKVIHVESQVPPCINDPCPSFGPDKEALYVLEINAGLAKKLGIGVGHQAEFYIGLP